MESSIERTEVAVKCWFTIAGIPMPLMFKIMADDDVVTMNYHSHAMQ